MAGTKKKQRFFPTDSIYKELKMADIESKVKSPPPLRALTPGHKVLLKKLGQQHHDITFAVGPAGTGKTFISVRKAIDHFLDGKFNKIVITRPNVGAGDDLGYLPGDINEKMAPWIAPIRDVFLECFSVHEFRRMVDAEEVEIVPLCFIRGRTFKNTIVIADEAQNTTPAQMKALLTRIGENSAMIVTGDVEQHDRLEGGVSGLADIVQRYEARTGEAVSLPSFIAGDRSPQTHRYDRIGLVRMNRADIVRHPVIDDVLELYED